MSDDSGDDHGDRWGDQPGAALVHVVAGALIDPAGRVLVARRPPAAHQGGLWEFPGGKLEPGEGVRQGLERELAEELGVRVLQAAPLLAVSHDYVELSVLLDVWTVTRWAGEPRGLESQPLRWLAPQEMRREEFPPADAPVIEALLGLPETRVGGG